jgi:hypothetical protein
LEEKNILRANYGEKILHILARPKIYIMVKKFAPPPPSVGQTIGNIMFYY